MKTSWKQLERSFELPEIAVKAQLVVGLFYSFIEFVALIEISNFSELARLPSKPFWPIFWSSLLDPVVLPYVFFFGFLITACAGMLWYRYRSVRVLVFLAVLQYQAYVMSVLGTHHFLYFLLFISCAFIFLPDIWRASPSEVPEMRRRFSLIVWGATAFMLLTYTMSGFYKVVSAFSQFFKGETSAFSSEAAALYVAHWLEQFERTSMVGPFIIEHPVGGWIVLLALLYLLTCSFWVAFKPSLYRLWGAGLILFHAGTLLSLGIIFQYNVFLVALFILNSPFVPKTSSWRDVALDLPIIGLVLRPLEARYSTTTS